MAISISNLTKIYGEQKAIDNISFNAADNEIVGFLGPNGAGKSTTMKIITGFLTADSGTALVNGINVSTHPLETKKQLGYLPEGNPLYYDMYVREYLSFIASVHHLGDVKKRIETVIDMTGLRLESNKKNGQLSKGYKQRVGLAAALIHDPKVLILDEPTSGLDPNQIVEIRNLIKELGKNKTVLFSSHILQEVQSVSDRVIIISKGKIVADDTLDRLQSNGNDAHTIIVEFGKTIDLSAISDLPEVTAAQQISNRFHLETTAPEILKRQLLEFSLQNNADIISLQSSSKSLEDIFRNLTS